MGSQAIPPFDYPEAGEASVGVLRAASAEVLAFARLASLIVRDRGPFLPPRVDPGDDVAILVHGLMATAAAMGPLRQRLEQIAGVRTATFTYPPGHGVAEVAAALSKLTAELPEDARLHLVGHSMGGLVVRWYVQETRSDPRVVQTISIAAPFEGARGARLMPGHIGRDIRRESALLTRLRRRAPEVGLPHLTILGGSDTAISSRTQFTIGDRIVVPGCGHNGLLFDRKVAEAVAGRVAAVRHAERQGAPRSEAYGRRASRERP